MVTSVVIFIVSVMEKDLVTKMVEMVITKILHIKAVEINNVRVGVKVTRFDNNDEMVVESEAIVT